MIGALILVALAWSAAGGSSSRSGDSTQSDAESGESPVGALGGHGRHGARSDGGVGDAGEEALRRMAERGERPPLVETPIPGFEPMEGEVDPGPGRDYMERYEGRSGAMSPSAHPGQHDVTTRLRSSGMQPHLVAWVPTIRIQAGAPVVISAQLVDDHDRPVSGDEVTIAIGRQGHEAIMMRAMPQAAPGLDHQYELTFPAPSERPADGDANTPVAYDYRIQATGTLDGEQFSRVVTGGFGVHDPPGAIDPTTLVVERDGTDIVLRFAVMTTREATFWGYSELWGGPEGGTAIAFGSDRFVAMPAGRHAVTLRFGGAIIHDRGVDGPYIVRNVKWMQVDAIPPQETEPILELPPTPDWPASSFQ